MAQAKRLISSIIFSIITFIGFCVLSVLLCVNIPPPFHIILGIVVLALGFYFSNMVHSMIMRRGLLNVISGSAASYDADDLEPVRGDVIKITPQELEKKFSKKELVFPSVNVAIWGDKYGRFLNAEHQLISISYNKTKNILTMLFNNSFKLKIRNPGFILASKRYLKIIKATEILWQVPAGSEDNHQYSYLNKGESIETKSNTDWQPSAYDFGPGMNALYLQA